MILWSVGNETPVDRGAHAVPADAGRGRARRRSDAPPDRGARAPPGGRRTAERIDDPLGADLDVLGLNEYVGWYDGLPEKCDTLTWSAAYDKPIVVSEFGADAKAGLHGDALTRFSEEYQADLYRRQLAMLRQGRRPCAGCRPGSWSTSARRAARSRACRTAGTARGWSPTTARKKQAFGVLRDAYRKLAAASRP